MIASATSTMIQKPGIKQFIKFCIIGATSTVIDVAILWLLTYRVGLWWVLAQTISFSFAVTNGFIWNSAWTFKGLGSGKRHEQYVKFVAVNIVGLALNVLIMKLFFMAVTGRFIHQGNPDPNHLKIAKSIAIVVVSSWNFFANKYWTFRHKPTEPLFPGN